MAVLLRRLVALQAFTVHECAWGVGTLIIMALSDVPSRDA